jgi:hypothetical protein
MTQQKFVRQVGKTGAQAALNNAQPGGGLRPLPGGSTKLEGWLMLRQVAGGGSVHAAGADGWHRCWCVMQAAARQLSYRSGWPAGGSSSKQTDGEPTGFIALDNAVVQVTTDSSVIRTEAVTEFPLRFYSFHLRFLSWNYR